MIRYVVPHAGFPRLLEKAAYAASAVYTEVYETAQGLSKHAVRRICGNPPRRAPGAAGLLAVLARLAGTVICRRVGEALVDAAQASTDYDDFVDRMEDRHDAIGGAEVLTAAAADPDTAAPMSLIDDGCELYTLKPTRLEDVELLSDAAEAEAEGYAASAGDYVRLVAGEAISAPKSVLEKLARSRKLTVCSGALVI